MEGIRCMHEKACGEPTHHRSRAHVIRERSCNEDMPSPRTYLYDARDSVIAARCRLLITRGVPSVDLDQLSEMDLMFRDAKPSSSEDRICSVHASLQQTSHQQLIVVSEDRDRRRACPRSCRYLSPSLSRVHGYQELIADFRVSLIDCRVSITGANVEALSTKVTEG